MSISSALILWSNICYLKYPLTYSLIFTPINRQRKIIKYNPLLKTDDFDDRFESLVKSKSIH